MKAVILCAGNGERLKPLTETIPKPLIEINNKPILYYIFSSLPELIEEVFLVIQEKHSVYFNEFLKNNNLNKKVKIIYQDTKDKGTYFALLSAKDYLDKEENFLVLNGDDIFLKEDVEKIIKIPSPVYGLSFKKLDKRYRTCELDELSKKIISFRRQNEDEYGKELPCFSGIFTLNKDFFNYTPVFYENMEAGIPHTLFANNKNVSYLVLKKWYQINNFEDLAFIKNELL